MHHSSILVVQKPDFLHNRTRPKILCIPSSKPLYNIFHILSLNHEQFTTFSWLQLMHRVVSWHREFRNNVQNNNYCS